MVFEKINDFKNIEMDYISKDSGGYISRNRSLFSRINLTRLNKFILKKSVFGSPIFKIGNGGNKLMIISGVHGNELAPQLASLSLIEELVFRDLNDTIYIIPFLAPNATMHNLRTFNHSDLNRATHINNSLSNKVLNKIKDFDITAVGDFHTTSANSNPGVEAVFCSQNPSIESYLIANYISSDLTCDIINYPQAASQYKGAMEDECNLLGIPAVTCEVLSPFGSVGSGSFERSFLQMKSFLSYFGI